MVNGSLVLALPWRGFIQWMVKAPKGWIPTPWLMWYHFTSWTILHCAVCAWLQYHYSLTPVCFTTMHYYNYSLCFVAMACKLAIHHLYALHHILAIFISRLIHNLFLDRPTIQLLQSAHTHIATPKTPIACTNQGKRFREWNNYLSTLEANKHIIMAATKTTNTGDLDVLHRRFGKLNWSLDIIIVISRFLKRHSKAKLLWKQGVQQYLCKRN